VFGASDEVREAAEEERRVLDGMRSLLQPYCHSWLWNRAALFPVVHRDAFIFPLQSVANASHT